MVEAKGAVRQEHEREREDGSFVTVVTLDYRGLTEQTRRCPRGFNLQSVYIYLWDLGLISAVNTNHCAARAATMYVYYKKTGVYH